MGGGGGGTESRLVNPFSWDCYGSFILYKKIGNLREISFILSVILYEPVQCMELLRRKFETLLYKILLVNLNTAKNRLISYCTDACMCRA